MISFPAGVQSLREWHSDDAADDHDIELIYGWRRAAKRSPGSILRIASATSRLVMPADAETTKTNIVGKRDIRATVHGVKISDAGTAKFGNNDPAHINLVSGMKRDHA